MTLRMLSAAPRDEEEPPRVFWEARGSTDVYGEWHYSGEDEAYIRRGQLKFNTLPYHVRLYRLRGKNYRVYGVHVELTDDFLRFTVKIEKGFRSKRKARERVQGIIREFEATNLFQDVVWPKVVRPNNQTHIIKKMKDGTYQHIATVFSSSGWGAIRGKLTFFDDMEMPFGHGEFWCNEPGWRLDKESNKTVYGRYWSGVEAKWLSLTGTSGGNVPDEVLALFNSPEFTEWIEEERDMTILDGLMC